MDPVARRFMWEVITDIVTKREKCSLILTTHSMVLACLIADWIDV
jgi:ABC-type multidrug transport system ATPase subunit